MEYSLIDVISITPDASFHFWHLQISSSMCLAHCSLSTAGCIVLVFSDADRCKRFWTCTNRGKASLALVVPGGLLVCSALKPLLPTGACLKSLAIHISEKEQSGNCLCMEQDRCRVACRGKAPLHMRRNTRLQHVERGCCSIAVTGSEFAICFTRSLPLDDTHQVCMLFITTQARTAPVTPHASGNACQRHKNLSGLFTGSLLGAERCGCITAAGVACHAFCMM